MIPGILRAHLQGTDHNAMVGGTAHHLERWHANLHREGKRTFPRLEITDHERTQPADHPLEEAPAHESPAPRQALATRRPSATRRLHHTSPTVERGWGDGLDLEEWP